VVVTFITFLYCGWSWLEVDLFVLSANRPSTGQESKSSRCAKWKSQLIQTRETGDHDLQNRRPAGGVQCVWEQWTLKTKWCLDPGFPSQPTENLFNGPFPSSEVGLEHAIG